MDRVWEVDMCAHASVCVPPLYNSGSDITKLWIVPNQCECLSQHIWSFSFSVSPSSEYSGLISFGLISFKLTGLISLCPRFSQESSPAPQFKSISSSVLSLLYGPTLTSVHDYWESHSFDYTDLCWQSDVSAVICINIRHVLFSFWFTLLCITGCRFVHLTTTDSNSVFKWLSNTHLSFLSESFLIYSLHLP